MADYFTGMHIYLCMRKSLLATVSSDGFNTLALNSKLSKLVSYIHNNKSWERIYVLLKLSVIRGVCNHQIPLQYMINHLSAQALANHLITIQQLLKRFQFFMGDNNTQKMMTSNDKRLTVAISDLNISEGLSITTYEVDQKEIAYLD